MAYMKTLVLFFFHPNQFFRKIHEGKLRVFLFHLFIAYVIVNIIWALQIDSSSNQILFPFNSDNEIVKILLSFIFDALLILSLSVILLIIARGLRVDKKLVVIVLSVFSVETIHITII